MFEREDALEQVMRGVAKTWASVLEEQLRLFYDMQRALHCVEECLRSAESAAHWLSLHKTLTTKEYHLRLVALCDEIRMSKDLLFQAVERGVPLPLVDRTAE